MATTTESLENFWHSHIAGWRASNLSRAAYCREHDLAYSRFIYWKRRLDEQVIASEGSAASAFVPVYCTDATPVPALTLHFPNGVTVEGVDAQSIHLLPALAEALS